MAGGAKPACVGDFVAAVATGGDVFVFGSYEAGNDQQHNTQRPENKKDEKQAEKD